jgi:hypothetical protein
MVRRKQHMWTDLVGIAAGSGSRRLRPGCRVLEMGADEGGLARLLAEAAPDCTVIVLDSTGNLLKARCPAGYHRPVNLEVLSCGIEGANFLPSSIAVAILTRERATRDALTLRMLARWLEPGGRLILISAPGRRWRFLRIGRMSVPPVDGYLSAKGFTAEPASGGSFEVFRKNS